MFSSQIKLTNKAREALLRAELIAWALDRKEVTEIDLRIALSEQADTVAKALEFELEDSDFYTERSFSSLYAEIKSAPLVFRKIGLNDALLSVLQQASVEVSKLDKAEINTGHLFIELLFGEKEFLEQLKELELSPPEIKEKLLEKAYSHELLKRELDCGDTVLSRFNRQAMNWLRDGKLTKELMHSNGIEDQDLMSVRTMSNFVGFFGDEENTDIPEVKPPYSRGIREKARRDLEVIDSYVAANNLPDSEPNLLGMFINNPQEFILFFEENFALLDGINAVSMRYNEIDSIETHYLHDDDSTAKSTSTIAITGGDNIEIELEVPGCSDELSDVFAIENFLKHTRNPQPIAEIVSDDDFVTFLKRQNENLDLYYQLAYKTKELGQLGWWDHESEKGAKHVLLLRLFAILVTVPVQSLSLSVSRSKQVS